LNKTKGCLIANFATVPITPARGPPLWEGCDAPVDDGAQGEPDWDLAAQPDEVDQRVNW